MFKCSCPHTSPAAILEFPIKVTKSLDSCILITAMFEQPLYKCLGVRGSCGAYQHSLSIILRWERGEIHETQQVWQFLCTHHPWLCGVGVW